MTSAVGAWVDKEKLSLAAQTQDAVLNQVFWHCKHHLLTPRKIFGKNYLYIDIDKFGQLVLVDGVVCRKYKPGPCEETVQVPLIPKTLLYNRVIACMS